MLSSVVLRNKAALVSIKDWLRKQKVFTRRDSSARVSRSEGVTCKCRLTKEFRLVAFIAKQFIYVGDQGSKIPNGVARLRAKARFFCALDRRYICKITVNPIFIESGYLENIFTFKPRKVVLIGPGIINRNVRVGIRTG